MNEPKEALDAWVDAHKNEILAETQAILRIPSVEDEASAGPGAPFGKPLADALEHTLALCARLGMKTENFDGYAGHAEFGGAASDDGSEIVGMLGHLDVVPPGSGWTRDPWGAAVEDGWIWARGASDDKGPTYAALWGAKAVLDVAAESGVALPRRIRLIFGCDEESGWDCMAHYFGAAGQPQPALAFTPDADFPLVYAEKGAFTAEASRTVTGDAAELRVAAFASGLRANMVPDTASALLIGTPGIVEIARAVLVCEPDITVAMEPEGLRVAATGKAAHGATPQEGDNAAVKLLRALVALPDFGPGDAPWMDDLIRRGAPDGKGVGIAGKDAETGPLTCNLGVVVKENDTVRATFNVRYPATWNGDETTGTFTASLAETGWSIGDLRHTPPLYVPRDQEPVKTLLRVYREQTGDESAPKTMGGRTYATSVAPHGVAFGPGLPGDPEVAHQADERFPVERLLLCAKIYAHALYALATLAG